MHADLDLDAIEAGHGQRHRHGVCLACGFWPCPVIILVAEVRRLRAESDDQYDEVRRLRALLAQCVDHIDPNDSDDAFRLLVECEEASRG